MSKSKYRKRSHDRDLQKHEGTRVSRNSKHEKYSNMVIGKIPAE
jgi:hypothetical protein